MPPINIIIFRLFIGLLVRFESERTNVWERSSARNSVRRFLESNNRFLDSENRFLDSENRFLESENHFHDPERGSLFDFERSSLREILDPEQERV